MKNRGYMRRLTKETHNLEVYMSVLSNWYDEKSERHVIRISLNKHIIDFKIPQNFPFRPPLIELNGKNYRDMLTFRTKYFQQIIKDNGISCLCCQSILCSAKWSPAYTLIDLVNEIKKNKKFIQAIVIRTRLVRQICESNDIQCIEIPELILNHLIEGPQSIVHKKKTRTIT